MDQPPDRPAALHRRRQVLDVVLARPQPPLPHLRPAGPITQSRRPPDRDRPRPHLHLLGMTLTNPLAAPLRATLRWGHLPSPPRGQFGLTLPASAVPARCARRARVRAVDVLRKRYQRLAARPLHYKCLVSHTSNSDASSFVFQHQVPSPPPGSGPRPKDLAGQSRWSCAPGQKRSVAIAGRRETGQVPS